MSTAYATPDVSGDVHTMGIVEAFGLNRPVPMEMVYFNRGGKYDEFDRGNFLLPEIVATSEDRAHVQFRDLETLQLIPLHLVFNSDGEVGVSNAAGTAAGLDQFVADNYSEWCGKWHNGIGGRKWRICTGTDCGDGIAICIQRKMPSP